MVATGVACTLPVSRALVCMTGPAGMDPVFILRMVAVVAVVIVARGARSMAVATTEVVTAIATTVAPAAIAAVMFRQYI